MSFFWFVVLSVAVFSLGFWLTQRLQNTSSRRQDFGAIPPKPANIGTTSPGTAQSPSPLPTNVQLKVQELMAKGQKIAAIKLVHQSTGWSLSAAKDYVEQLPR
jgi:ribosomal protein L7/L12